MENSMKLNLIRKILLVGIVLVVGFEIIGHISFKSLFLQKMDYILQDMSDKFNTKKLNRTEESFIQLDKDFEKATKKVQQEYKLATINEINVESVGNSYQFEYVVQDGNYEYELVVNPNQNNLVVHDQEVTLSTIRNDSDFDLLKMGVPIGIISQNVMKKYPNHKIREYEFENIGEQKNWIVHLSDDLDILVDAKSGEIIQTILDD